MESAADPHRTSVALDKMLADYDAGHLNLNGASPEQLRVLAESYASTAMVDFQHSVVGQAWPEWRWAQDALMPGDLSGAAAPPCTPKNCSG